MADLLAGVREELGLHASYAARWGIDMAGVEPASATLAYTEFLLATAATGGVGMVFAAMTPCMRLYAWLGAALDAGAAGPYAQWVQTYADPSFEALASRLERLLDEHACARGLPAGDAPGAGVFRRSAPTLRLSTTSAAADAKTPYCSTSRSKPASAA